MHCSLSRKILHSTYERYVCTFINTFMCIHIHACKCYIEVLPSVTYIYISVPRCPGVNQQLRWSQETQRSVDDVPVAFAWLKHLELVLAFSQHLTPRTILELLKNVCQENSKRKNIQNISNHDYSHTFCSSTRRCLYKMSEVWQPHSLLLKQKCRWRPRRWNCCLFFFK